MGMFRIQLHKDEKTSAAAVSRAERALNEPQPAIGLDFESDPDLGNRSLADYSDDDFDKVKAAYTEAEGSPGATQNLRQFYQIKTGDIGLVHGGATPVALVRVAGPYQFCPDADSSEALWFRHRFPVEIIGWYARDQAIHPEISVTPQPRGAFQRLINVDGETYKAMLNWLHYKETDMNFDSALQVINQFRQVVLTGPPGTGKTFHALRLAARLCGFTGDDAGAGEADLSQHAAFLACRMDALASPAEKGRWALVQFHPGYNYEDFIRGVRIRTQDGEPIYETKDRIFAELASMARKSPTQNHVLIIDEVNRAPLASVLGELIFALEYRDFPISLAYELSDDPDAESHNPLGRRELVVPRENFLVIATMNTADRSIGHIDYAVRRRFAFIPMLPDRTAVASQSAEISPSACALYDAVAGLFIKNGTRSQYLSPEFYPDDVQPGHTYFLARSKPELVRKFTYQVYPLLREYYKDGILVGDNLRLPSPLENIMLAEPMTPGRVHSLTSQAIGDTEQSGS